MRRAEGSVLVVDDDATIRMVVREALEDEGCAVREAADGREALALLDEETPDVIVLDMRMPVLDGWGFAREYRKRPGPHAPIVVLTATRDAAAWAAEVHADAVVGKPFEVDGLLDVLRRFTPCVPPG